MESAIIGIRSLCPAALFGCPGSAGTGGGTPTEQVPEIVGLREGA